MITLLRDGGAHAVAGGRTDGDALWLPVDAAEAASGWQLKPEGLCRGDVCVPVPPGEADAFVGDGEVNIAAFWRRMGKPLAASDNGTVWALGEGAADRAAALDSLEAPDFELPDLAGQHHRLSDHRGRKVLLTTWASW